MPKPAAVAAGIGFACLEQLLTWGFAGRYLESVFRSNKALPANQVRPAVHQAATNLVGMLHVFIVVGFWLQYNVLILVYTSKSHLATLLKLAVNAFAVLTSKSTACLVCTGCFSITVAHAAGATCNLCLVGPKNDPGQTVRHLFNIQHHAGHSFRLFPT